MGPRHDRIRLTDAELHVLSELERSLPGSDAEKSPSMRRRLRERARRAGLVVAPLVRLAPWLLPIGTFVMVAFIIESVVISFLGALLAACGMAAVLSRVARRIRARAGRRSGPSP